jgi:hypothetical protein
MMGEELNAVEVSEVGLLGDRAYAIVDVSDGKIASAKNPRKWPDLFCFRAAFVDPPHSGDKIPPVRITLPGGTAIRRSCRVRFLARSTLQQASSSRRL